MESVSNPNDSECDCANFGRSYYEASNLSRNNWLQSLLELKSFERNKNIISIQSSPFIFSSCENWKKLKPCYFLRFFQTQSQNDTLRRTVA